MQRLALAAPLLALALAGCHRPDPGTEEDSLDVDGRTRTFLVHVPASAPPEGERMLVISLHGNGGRGSQQEDLSGFTPLAEEKGFVAIYPDGVDKSWADGRGTTDAEEQGVDDVAFIAALIDHGVATYGVDPRRVFVTGFSNGSMMTNRLGCELADRIAAIGPVSGTLPDAIASGCTPSRPPSVMIFHGTADEFAPYSGGEVSKGAGGVVLSAPDTRAWWADKAGCGPDTTVTDEPDRDGDPATSVRRAASDGCVAGEVVLYTVDGGGHTWPGSQDNLGERLVGPSTDDIDAARLLVDFFTAHPLP